MAPASTRTSRPIIARSRPTRVATAFLLLALSAVTPLSGCGGLDGSGPGGTPTTAPSTSTPGTTVPSASTPGTAAPSTSTPGPTGRTASAQLTPFLDKARTFDSELHALARMVNAGVTAKSVTISNEAAAAARALDPAAVARTVPAGMDARLLRATVLVYSELSSRLAAFNGLAQGTWPRPGPTNEEPSAGWILGCLGNGAAAAARFEKDLSAVRILAGSMPQFRAASAGSKAAGEVAVRAALIEEYNNGCDSCGGFVATDWPLVTWRAGRTGGGAPGEEPFDGTIGEVGFWATYSKSSGWAVRFPMC